MNSIRLRCQVCLASFNSVYSFKSHVQSHRAKIKEIFQNDNVVMSDYLPYIVFKNSKRSKADFVGLSYLTLVFGAADVSGCFYLCHVCRLKCPLEGILGHLRSEDHVTNYLSIAMPNALIFSWMPVGRNKAPPLSSECMRKSGELQMLQLPQKVLTVLKSSLYSGVMLTLSENEKLYQCLQAALPNPDLVKSYQNDSKRKNPLLGLQHIVECVCVGRSNERSYLCTLCHLTVAAHMIMKHILSFDHVFRYFEEWHPSTLLSKASYKEDNSFTSTMLNLAKQAEEIQGSTQMRHVSLEPADFKSVNSLCYSEALKKLELIQKCSLETNIEPGRKLEPRSPSSCPSSFPSIFKISCQVCNTECSNMSFFIAHLRKKSHKEGVAKALDVSAHVDSQHIASFNLGIYTYITKCIQKNEPVVGIPMVVSCITTEVKCDAVYICLACEKCFRGPLIEEHFTSQKHLLRTLGHYQDLEALPFAWTPPLDLDLAGLKAKVWEKEKPTGSLKISIKVLDLPQRAFLSITTKNYSEVPVLKTSHERHAKNNFPLLGQQFLVFYDAKTKDPQQYKASLCLLCKRKLSEEESDNHLFCLQHVTTFLNKFHPGSLSSSSINTETLLDFARQAQTLHLVNLPQTVNLARPVIDTYTYEKTLGILRSGKKRDQSVVVEPSITSKRRLLPNESSSTVEDHVRSNSGDTTKLCVDKAQDGENKGAKQTLSEQKTTLQKQISGTASEVVEKAVEPPQEIMRKEPECEIKRTSEEIPESSPSTDKEAAGERGKQEAAENNENTPAQLSTCGDKMRNKRSISSCEESLEGMRHKRQRLTSEGASSEKNESSAVEKSLKTHQDEGLLTLYDCRCDKRDSVYLCECCSVKFPQEELIGHITEPGHPKAHLKVVNLDENLYSIVSKSSFQSARQTVSAFLTRCERESELPSASTPCSVKNEEIHSPVLAQHSVDSVRDHVQVEDLKTEDDSKTCEGASSVPAVTSGTEAPETLKEDLNPHVDLKPHDLNPHVNIKHNDDLKPHDLNPHVNIKHHDDLKPHDLNPHVELKPHDDPKLHDDLNPHVNKSPHDDLKPHDLNPHVELKPHDDLKSHVDTSPHDDLKPHDLNPHVELERHELKRHDELKPHVDVNPHVDIKPHDLNPHVDIKPHDLNPHVELERHELKRHDELKPHVDVNPHVDIKPHDLNPHVDIKPHDLNPHVELERHELKRHDELKPHVDVNPHVDMKPHDSNPHVDIKPHDLNPHVDVNHVDIKPHDLNPHVDISPHVELKPHDDLKPDDINPSHVDLKSQDDLKPHVEISPHVELKPHVDLNPHLDIKPHDDFKPHDLKPHDNSSEKNLVSVSEKCPQANSTPNTNIESSGTEVTLETDEKVTLSSVCSATSSQCTATTDEVTGVTPTSGAATFQTELVKTSALMCAPLACKTKAASDAKYELQNVEPTSPVESAVVHKAANMKMAENTVKYPKTAPATVSTCHMLTKSVASTKKPTPAMKNGKPGKEMVFSPHIHDGTQFAVPQRTAVKSDRPESKRKPAELPLTTAKKTKSVHGTVKIGTDQLIILMCSKEKKQQVYCQLCSVKLQSSDHLREISHQYNYVKMKIPGYTAKPFEDAQKFQETLTLLEKEKGQSQILEVTFDVYEEMNRLPVNTVLQRLKEMLSQRSWKGSSSPTANSVAALRKKAIIGSPCEVTSSDDGVTLVKNALKPGVGDPESTSTPSKTAAASEKIPVGSQQRPSEAPESQDTLKTPQDAQKFSHVTFLGRDPRVEPATDKDMHSQSRSSYQKDQAAKCHSRPGRKRSSQELSTISVGERIEGVSHLSTYVKVKQLSIIGQGAVWECQGTSQTPFFLCESCELRLLSTDICKHMISKDHMFKYVEKYQSELLYFWRNEQLDEEGKLEFLEEEKLELFDFITSQLLEREKSIDAKIVLLGSELYERLQKAQFHDALKVVQSISERKLKAAWPPVCPPPQKKAKQDGVRKSTMDEESHDVPKRKASNPLDPRRLPSWADSVVARLPQADVCLHPKEMDSCLSSKHQTESVPVLPATPTEDPKSMSSAPVDPEVAQTLPGSRERPADTSLETSVRSCASDSAELSLPAASAGPPLQPSEESTSLSACESMAVDPAENPTSLPPQPENVTSVPDQNAPLDPFVALSQIINVLRNQAKGNLSTLPAEDNVKPVSHCAVTTAPSDEGKPSLLSACGDMNTTGGNSKISGEIPAGLGLQNQLLTQSAIKSPFEGSRMGDDSRLTAAAAGVSVTAATASPADLPSDPQHPQGGSDQPRWSAVATGAATPETSDTSPIRTIVLGRGNYSYSSSGSSADPVPSAVSGDPQVGLSAALTAPTHGTNELSVFKAPVHPDLSSTFTPSVNTVVANSAGSSVSTGADSVVAPHVLSAVNLHTNTFDPAVNPHANSAGSTVANPSQSFYHSAMGFPQTYPGVNFLHLQAVGHSSAAGMEAMWANMAMQQQQPPPPPQPYQQPPLPPQPYQQPPLPPQPYQQPPPPPYQQLPQPYSPPPQLYPPPFQQLPPPFQQPHMYQQQQYQYYQQQWYLSQQQSQYQQ
ncbi:uncharacterized protein LOC115409219 isoform X2 [Salarias fasciatus]|uniref:uncharacterized protein LOC115409219 isoform X2 n=1 Tax=Salarias fasciatus TaxID=181472 RepID=UPI001176711D|nr:uncharacterized protein LOC115409219 isoform X2 [Salarias fasciatus]